jgi:hypothetical protein
VGITANSKIYDGDRIATFSVDYTKNLDQAILQNKVDGDEVYIESITGLFQNKNRGISKVIDISNIKLNGDDSKNYSITPPIGVKADIAERVVSVSGIVAVTKIFDKTTEARLTLTGATLNGILDGNLVRLDTSKAKGTYADNTVNKGKLVTISDIVLTGLDADNYKITVNPVFGEIAANGDGIVDPIIVQRNHESFTQKLLSDQTKTPPVITSKSPTGEIVKLLDFGNDYSMYNNDNETIQWINQMTNWTSLTNTINTRLTSPRLYDEAVTSVRIEPQSSEDGPRSMVVADPYNP